MEIPHLYIIGQTGSGKTTHTLHEALTRMDGLAPSEVFMEGVLQKMVHITEQPWLIPTFNFGKHIGKKVADVAKVDRGYLEWLLEQKKLKPEGEEDWLFTLKHHLKV